VNDLGALEREVEASREKLSLSLSQLRQQMRPASLANELLGLLSPAGTGSIQSSARQLALRHPVPLLVLGLGLSFAYWRTGRHPDGWGRKTPLPSPLPSDYATTPANLQLGVRSDEHHEPGIQSAERV
jgi:hypothetical protein